MTQTAFVLSLFGFALLVSLPWLVPAILAMRHKREVRKTGFDVDAFLAQRKRQQVWPGSRWDDREYARERKKRH